MTCPRKRSGLSLDDINPLFKFQTSKISHFSLFIILFILKLGQSKTKLRVLKNERVINGINRKEKMHFNNSSDHFDGLLWQEFLSCPPFYIFHRIVSSINLSNPIFPKGKIPSSCISFPKNLPIIKLFRSSLRTL